MTCVIIDEVNIIEQLNSGNEADKTEQIQTHLDNIRLAYSGLFSDVKILMPNQIVDTRVANKLQQIINDRRARSAPADSQASSVTNINQDSKSTRKSVCFHLK